jgi:hypothetical protein
MSIQARGSHNGSIGQRLSTTNAIERIKVPMSRGEDGIGEVPMDNGIMVRR